MRPTCIDKVFELAKRDTRVTYIGSDLDPPLTRRMKEEMRAGFGPPPQPYQQRKRMGSRWNSLRV